MHSKHGELYLSTGGGRCESGAWRAQTRGTATNEAQAGDGGLE